MNTAENSRYRWRLLTIALFLFIQAGLSQDIAVKTDIASTGFVSARTIRAIEKKVTFLQKALRKKSQQALSQLQKQEANLQKRLSKKDSTTAQQLFGSSDASYAGLAHQLNDSSYQPKPTLKNYESQLDSLQCLFKLANTDSNKSPNQKQSIAAASKEITALSKQLQVSVHIQDFITERKAQLTTAFEKAGMGKQLLSFKKEAYYYQAQVKEYRQLLKDPDKMAEKALSIARNTPAFKDFISKNGLLAQLFPAPKGYGTPAALAGLQTRLAIQQQLTQQVNAGGSGAQQYLQQQITQAQAQLGRLKDQMKKFGGGSNDIEIPDFKPNNQKTKSFWNRIEYGLNIQSQKTNAFMPVTSDIAVTAGYKLNDKSVIGVGIGYKLGWGKNISTIKITSEGLSLRTYIDIKAKGSIWISGGYEYNYQQSFVDID